MSEEKGVRERKEKLATLASVKTGETQTRACGDQCFSRVLTIASVGATMHVAFAARCMETVRHAPLLKKERKSQMHLLSLEEEPQKGAEREGWSELLGVAH